jgi:hypothetical protein
MPATVMLAGYDVVEGTCKYSRRQQRFTLM